ncbi:KpsF/GutQ family sugar-phosphate isomerase [Sphingosinicella terrae]|uniref:KpsF/GutQ family sugar-phosphate isomerase n=1 Tax=Sphingosinicella terrae TaxID=2172047 RepID=UPI002548E1E7|nr:KpsF/GutQ family sugar-phosphate isomerase [Sphingosinicella terrae]
MTRAASLALADPGPMPELPAGALAGWFREVLESERAAIGRFLAGEVSGIDSLVAEIAGQDRPLVCLGIGKSGLVAAKVAATFSSLGTPAFFLNAAEAAHGDLGAVQTGNLVIIFSNSGTTEEIVRILPVLKSRQCRLIGIVGRPDSPIAAAVDHLVPSEIEREADHIGMAPTASTILQMAIGDGLAVAASRARGFAREDFLRQHPAGLLGRQMIRIRHLMRKGDDLPTVLPHASVADVTGVISARRVGAACVIDWEGKLLGLIVDGDIRRLAQRKGDFYATTAGEIMQANPRVVGPDLTVADTLLLLKEADRRFDVLPVVDGNGILLGLLSSWDVVQ